MRKYIVLILALLFVLTSCSAVSAKYVPLQRIIDVSGVWTYSDGESGTYILNQCSTKIQGTLTVNNGQNTAKYRLCGTIDVNGQISWNEQYISSNGGSWVPTFHYSGQITKADMTTIYGNNYLYDLVGGPAHYKFVFIMPNISGLQTQLWGQQTQLQTLQTQNQIESSTGVGHYLA